jgi:hypothetical protein
MHVKARSYPKNVSTRGSSQMFEGHSIAVYVIEGIWMLSLPRNKYAHVAHLAAAEGQTRQRGIQDGNHGSCAIIPRSLSIPSSESCEKEAFAINIKGVETPDASDVPTYPRRSPLLQLGSSSQRRPKAPIRTRPCHLPARRRRWGCHASLHPPAPCGSDREHHSLPSWSAPGRDACAAQQADLLRL